MSGKPGPDASRIAYLAGQAHMVAHVARSRGNRTVSLDCDLIEALALAAAKAAGVTLDADAARHGSMVGIY